MTIRPLHLAILVPVLLAAIAVLSPGPAAAQTIDFSFHWSQSPTRDEAGRPLAAAVEYEVWLKRGAAMEERIGVARDTLYTLAASANVVQRIRVCGYDELGRQSVFSDWSEPIYFESHRTSSLLPPAPVLRGNYPNPFNPETRIVYGVPEGTSAAATVELEVLDMRGRRVRTLDVTERPGWHEAMWDGTDQSGRTLPTGPYLVRFSCAGEAITRKMIMVK
ncbi:MAG: FlgD immunoglobulin-like domain containing protein [Candidatus Krumholzibacteriia bacterium]